MKRILIAILAMLAVACLLTAGAFAKGNGNAPQGSKQPQGSMPQGGNGPDGGQMAGNGMAKGIQPGQSGQMPGSVALGSQYGRFLDVGKLGEAVALMNEGDAKYNMVALMAAYQEAVQSKNQAAVQEALQMMIRAMTQTMDQSMEQTQLQLTEQDWERLRNFHQGGLLDTVAVAEAIAALTDETTVTSLQTLYQTYVDAVAAGDLIAVQEALVALMNGMAEAGIVL